MGDGRNGQDCQGHGTHVAGTVGSADYGVAPKARLVSVRVLGCDGKGTLAGIIAGFDWVAKHAQQPAVANASLGGSYSPALNDAANALADAGVLPVVAAGNDAQDACRVSPASADRVLTVGATDSSDSETGFSNYGRCLSLLAPGQAIVSAKLGGGSVALDGTSMASPHAAGVALLYKAANPGANAAAVAGWVDTQSTKDVLKIIQNTPNRLLFTGGL
jgi:subtilisin family serine protease